MDIPKDSCSRKHAGAHESMSSRIISFGVILSGLVGGLSGVVCTRILSDPSGDPQIGAVDPNTKIVDRTGRSESELVDLSALDGRLRSMERQVSRMGDAARAPLQEGPADEQIVDQDTELADARREGRPTIEMEQELEQEMWESRLEQFEDESTDPEWAREMESRVINDYDAIVTQGAGSGKIERLECKQSRCKMEMRWDTQRAMRRNSQATLHAFNDVSRNCVRHLNRQSEDGRAVLIFDCVGRRAEQG